jgi:hypothetical protein
MVLLDFLCVNDIAASLRSPACPCDSHQKTRGSGISPGGGYDKSRGGKKARAFPKTPQNNSP